MKIAHVHLSRAIEYVCIWVCVCVFVCVCVCVSTEDVIYVYVFVHARGALREMFACYVKECSWHIFYSLLLKRVLPFFFYKTKQK